METLHDFNRLGNTAVTCNNMRQGRFTVFNNGTPVPTRYSIGILIINCATKTILKFLQRAYNISDD